MGRPTDVLICYRTRRRLGAYLDGALGADVAHSTERHLSGCTTCQGEVVELRRVKVLVLEASAVPEPDWTGFWPGVVRGIEDARRGAAPARPRRGLRFWPQWAAGGAAIAALALALVFWQGARGPVLAEAGVLVNAAATEHPGATVMVYAPPEQDLAVVWVFDSD